MPISSITIPLFKRLVKWSRVSSLLNLHADEIPWIVSSPAGDNARAIRMLCSPNGLNSPAAKCVPGASVIRSF